MTIAPLTCGACGAAVPLANGDVARCRHCSASVPIPEPHRDLRNRVEAARASRREVERLLRGRPSLLWLRRVYPWTVIPAAVVGVPLLFAITQSEYGWFAREWVVLAGILPFMVTLLPWLVLWAVGSPQAYLHALGLELRPAPPPPDTPGYDCGACGAPLELEANAYAATCDYCHADSWVREPPEGWNLDREERREATNLADLHRARGFQRFDIRLLLGVYSLVTALSCLLFWHLLPGRAEYAALKYERSVGYTWALVGRPGPVVDLAAVGGDLVAVGEAGQALELVGDDWHAVGDSAGFRGVGADGQRALLVGERGKAAWLEGGTLRPVDVGLEVDLADAGGHGERAVVVGAEGRAAHFDGSRWTAIEPAGGNDLLDAWGNPERVWAVGGLSVLELVGSGWSGQLLTGLPRIVALAGHGEDVYIATAPLDEREHGTVVYRLEGDEWRILEMGTSDVTALAAGPGVLWGVGPDGYVFQWRNIGYAQPSPGPGDLHAAVMVHGTLVVGGDDGVFRRTE